MTRIPPLLTRLRRSRLAAAASVAALGLGLSLAAPSVMSALGSLSAPVGCHSAVVGDHSDPCVLTPGTDVDDDGGDDGGDDSTTGADVISATPTFTG
jgi:hypothetical protein